MYRFCGIVANKIIPRMGHSIGAKGPVAIRMAKECVNAANEMSLEQGLLFERRNFHALFATSDQKEVSDK